MQIFIQLSPTVMKLYHIKYDRLACVSTNAEHFEHNGGCAPYGITTSQLEVIG